MHRFGQFVVALKNRRTGQQTVTTKSNGYAPVTAAHMELTSGVPCPTGRFTLVGFG